MMDRYPKYDQGRAGSEKITIKKAQPVRRGGGRGVRGGRGEKAKGSYVRARQHGSSPTFTTTHYSSSSRQSFLVDCSLSTLGQQRGLTTKVPTGRCVIVV